MKEAVADINRVTILGNWFQSFPLSRCRVRRMRPLLTTVFWSRGDGRCTLQILILDSASFSSSLNDGDWINNTATN